MAAVNHNPKMLSRLLEHSLSEDPRLRSAAYMAMRHFPPGEDVISCLIKGLSDENELVRETAARTLDALGQRRAVGSW